MNTVQTKSAKRTGVSALRRTATLVGILYILGTVAGFCSAIAKPYFDAPDYLLKVAGNTSPVILGALFLLAMGLALAMMSVLLYPVLKRQDATLAMGYVVFRGALETATYIIVASCWLISAALGRAAAQSGADIPALQAVGAALTDPRAGSAITTIFFISGALMFYSLLYRTRLVPRWISVWGLASALPYIAAGLLVLFGAVGSGSAGESLLCLPMMVQEMVLAVWLIVKGFNTGVIKSLSDDKMLEETGK
jgi:hypothetical protein